MKKLLLLGAFLIGSYFTVNAQGTCAAALTLAGDGSTVSAPTITGTYPVGGTVCTFADGDATAPKATWYKFTPTSSGVLTIDAGIAPNPAATTAGDTRLRILGGTCGNFTCIAQNDDISYPSDLRSRISNLPVSAGTTYYIVWDNRWTATAFSFKATFTAQSCFAPSGFTYVGTPTTTSVTLGWTAPTAGSAPGSYQIEYGPYGFTQGSGTTVTATGALQKELTPLQPSTAYQFYIRSVCGGFDGNSNWVGPISFTTVFTPATVPYNMSFDTLPTLDLVGWFAPDVTAGAQWDVVVGDASAPAQNGANLAFVGASGGVSNTWMFSRPIAMTANQSYTLTYYMRKATFAGAGNVNNLQVTYGNAATIAAQTNNLATYANYASTTYELKTHTITPAATGSYVIGFNYTAPVHAQANYGAILLDNVSVTAAAGTDEVLASQFAVFPNPATNVVTVAGFDALVDSVELIDLNGRTVKTVKVNGVAEAQINISDLSAGVYMMNISSDKGKTTKKIVKQ
ncbi:MAG: T9SS type A sorting domain-containing protein [Flavobacterium sp.]